MLYIAEKPELARAIVEALGDGEMKNGHYACGKDQVTWCFGHMLRLTAPEEYDPSYKTWALDKLPICFLPWEKKPIAKSKDQLKVILGLLKKTDTVVNAGDPDAEGQLLIDEILHYAGFKGAVKRVLINDNTPVLVRKAIENMRDNAEFQGLSASAEARQICDCVYGVNLTRLYTIMARREGYHGVMSVGRVQTPILGLVVRRDLENSGHKKQFYSVVEATFQVGDIQFSTTYRNRPDDAQDEKGRLTDADASQKLADSLAGKKGVVTFFETSNGTTPPPLPYNLLKLQSDASRIYGMLPDRVKTITQSLREKFRLITYNRSDCQYLSEEQHQDAPQVIASISSNVADLKDMTASADCTIKSRAFNTSKVSAHHAIIPTQTTTDLSALSDDERNIYQLIARAYLIQFMPNHEWDKTSVTIDVDGILFTRSFRVTTDKGWRISFDAGDKEEDESSVPAGISSGAEVVCIAGKCRQKETKPKPLYTTSSLLDDLTRVAQYIKDDKLRQALVNRDKNKSGEHGGIGTPATRDEIIKTLFDRGFIETHKKGSTINIVSTKTGREFYALLPDVAKFPDLTAVWHEQQLDIEHGELDTDTFVKSVLSHIKAEIDRVSKCGLGLKLEKYPCPSCGAALFKRTGPKGTFWGCSSFPACRKTVPDNKGKPAIKQNASLN